MHFALGGTGCAAVIDPAAFVHPQACVDGSVTIGPRSRVWQFASVIRGAKIGADVNIASGACVDGSEIGDGSIICHNLAMGPGFRVGRNCFIGPNVTFCNDAFPRAAKGGFKPELFDGRRFAVILEDGASIGANAVILPGVVVGQRAMVAAGAVVSRSVPPYSLLTRSGDIRTLAPGERMRFAEARGSAL